MSAKRSVFRLVSGLALSSAAVISTLSALSIQPSFAQTNQGLCILNCGDSEYRLPYTLRNNSPRNTRAHYFLRVPGTRMERAASKLRISYPETFTNRSGAFDTDRIEVRRGRRTGGSEIPVDEVVWLQEANQLEIYLTEDIPADTSFVIVLSGVRNPNRTLANRFLLHTESQGDVLPRYVGAWELDIARE